MVYSHNPLFFHAHFAAFRWSYARLRATVRPMPSPVQTVFRRLRAHAVAAFPGFDITIRMGEPSEFPALRDHAYCIDVQPPAIVYAPKLERADAARIEGVLRHEFGHALAFFTHSPEHTERDADTVAALVFGAPIRYDADDVQTTGEGVTPRPRRLGL